MTLEEFHENRKPFYINPDTMAVKFPTTKHSNVSHAEWFTEMSIPYMHTIRGYLWETDEHSEDFIMLYWNDFSIPNTTCLAMTYLFEYFPHIKWIGLGCKCGEVGEIWEPRIKVYKNF